MYDLFKLYRTEEEWLQCSGQVLLTWSIFNPNGPTLKCIGLKDTGANGEQEVFYRWMHFLGGNDYCLGYFNNREEDWGKDLADILWSGLNASLSEFGDESPLINSIPSFVTLRIDSQWVEFFRNQVVGTEIMRGADWGREQYYINKYADDLFGRAGEEMREAYEELTADPEQQNEGSKEYLKLMHLQHAHISSFMNWEPGQYQSRPLNEADIESWWATVTDPKFVGAGVAQWAAAWAGGAAQSGMEQKTRFEDVRDFLAHFQHGIWPENFTP